MLRVLGFFVVVLLVWQVLRFVPVFGSIPFVGFWVSVLLVSFLVERGGERLIRRRRDRSALRELGHVDNPYNRGKLGTLLASRGRHREALPHLAAAVAGEPDVPEWSYRLGATLLAVGRPAEALPHLERAIAADEAHAYGAVLLRLAEALTSLGRPGEALAILARFDQNHGEGPESAYRRGLAQRKLGRSADARASFRRVSELVALAAGFQRKDARRWGVRAWVASWL